MGEHNFFLKSKTKLHLLWILKGKKNNEDQPSNGGMSESECSGGEWLRDGCIAFRVVSLEMAWLQRQQFLLFHDFSAENFRQIFRINYVGPLCRDDSPGFLEMLRFRKWRSECKGKIPFQFWKKSGFYKLLKIQNLVNLLISPVPVDARQFVCDSIVLSEKNRLQGDEGRMLGIPEKSINRKN